MDRTTNMQQRIAALEKALETSGYDEYGGDYSPELVEALCRPTLAHASGIAHIACPIQTKSKIHFAIPSIRAEEVVFPGQEARACVSSSLGRFGKMREKVFVAGKVCVVAAPVTYDAKGNACSVSEVLYSVLNILGELEPYDTVVLADDGMWDAEVREMCEKEGLPIIYDTTGSGPFVIPDGWENVSVSVGPRGMEIKFLEEPTSKMLPHLKYVYTVQQCASHLSHVLVEQLCLNIFSSEKALQVADALSFNTMDFSEYATVFSMTDMSGVSLVDMVKRLGLMCKELSLIDEDIMTRFDNFILTLSLWEGLCTKDEKIPFGRGFRIHKRPTCLASSINDAVALGTLDEALEKLCEEGRKEGINLAYEAIAQGVPAADASA